MGDRPIRKLFTKAQRAFFAEHAPEGVGTRRPDDPRADQRNQAQVCADRLQGQTVAEIWFYPDGSHILELSTKCVPAEAMQVAAEGRAFLAERGVDLGGEQQTKTRTTLESLREGAHGVGVTPGSTTSSSDTPRWSSIMRRYTRVLRVVVRARGAGFGCTISPSRVIVAIAASSDGLDAGGGRAEHRRAEQHGVGLGRHRDRYAERVGVRLQPATRSPRSRRRRRAGRSSRPASASASTMWRVAYASACSAARYQHARSSTSSRMRTPGDAAGERRVGERRTVAEHVRLPVPVGGEHRRRGRRRPRACRARGRASGTGRSPSRRERGMRCAAPKSRNAPDAEMPASVQPPVRAAALRSTDPTRPARRRARPTTREMTRRRAGDDREAAFDRGRRRPAAPSMPSAPACASMSETPTGVPGAQRRARRRPRAESARRRARPGTRTRVPMRANPSAARSSSPIASKYDGSQRRSWPR